MSGRTDQNIKTVFQKKNAKKGDYVLVKITDCTTATLLGDIVEIL
jgi:tRNA-2-methylthio-N6-dimethylallyladenosine synthase